MLQITNTPNYAGVTVAGGYQDLDELYEALHEIVGDEDELPQYESTRIRVLGVCYDIRHSLMGNRGAITVPNGFDRERARYMPMIAPDTNVYLTLEVIWPELLFVSFSLNDFIQLYEKRTNTHPWDPTPSQLSANSREPLPTACRQPCPNQNSATSKNTSAPINLTDTGCIDTTQLSTWIS